MKKGRKKLIWIIPAVIIGISSLVAIFAGEKIFGPLGGEDGELPLCMICEMKKR